MRYLLLICLKEEKSGASKFANNTFAHCRIAAMTGLDPHAQVIIIFLPSVVFNLEEDPVEQSGFVAVH